MQIIIIIILLIVSAACFALAAFAPKVAGNRVALIPLGLLLLVLVFLIQAIQVQTTLV